MKPNFFIVGAAKSGTTSLHNYLNQHPHISMSKRKEPQFFSKVLIPDDHPIKPIRNEKEYLDLFEISQETKICGESTAHYLPDPNAALLIKQFNSNSKILITLRNPIIRTFSAYYDFIKKPNEQNRFLEQITYEISCLENYKKPEHMIVGNSLYYKNVKKYLDVFGSNNVKIIFMEEWQNDIENTVRDILKFLKINSELKLIKKSVYNKYSEIEAKNRFSKQVLENQFVKKFTRIVIPKSIRKNIEFNILKKEIIRPEIKQQENKLLIKFFKKDVEKLETLLNRRVPWSEFH